MRIELTEEEREAAVVAIHSHVWSATIPCADIALKAAIRAINKVREGDPVGTIRRRETKCRYAIKTSSTERPWRVINYEGETTSWATELAVSNWAVIYTPEES